MTSPPAPAAAPPEEETSGGEVVEKKPFHIRDQAAKGRAVSKAKREKLRDEDPIAYLKKIEKRARRGGIYRKIERQGLLPELLQETLTHREAANLMGCSDTAVSFAMSAYEADWLKHKLGVEHEKDIQGLEFGNWIDVYSMTDEELEEVADYFAKWRARHFVTPQRTPYVTKSFHRRWIVAILRTIRDNGNLLILSPPRHGKTELLIHFDIFFITRVNPNISIVRVCKSEGLAKKGLSSVMDHLENNDQLKEECPTLKPGQSWQPEYRSGKPWNSAEFTVATREITGLKSPTVAAVGAGGTLLSRDGDVFVVDDIEDQQTVYTADMREKRRTWFNTDLMSRKVETNAVIYIGSRQHPDDIPGHLLDNPEWEVIVERAHDEVTCEVEEPESPLNWDKHIDCVLWPEVRSFKWLMSIKHDPERASTYPMIYLNHPTDEDVDVFSRSVVDVAKDERRVHQSELHMMPLNVPPEITDHDGVFHPIRLVAGLDPSGSGYQASFLWGLDLAAFKLFAVDYENRLGGGLHRAYEVIERWHAVYGVRDWVIEENLYHGAFLKDEKIQTLCNRLGITLHPHQTGTNKWDQTMGVGVLARLMQQGDISIPWGSVESQVKWKPVISQYINFSRDGGNGRRSSRGNRGARSNLTDIVMASWFPLALMQRWRRDWMADRVEEEVDDSYPFDPFSDMYSDLFSAMAR